MGNRPRRDSFWNKSLTHRAHPEGSDTKARLRWSPVGPSLVGDSNLRPHAMRLKVDFSLREPVAQRRGLGFTLWRLP